MASLDTPPATAHDAPLSPQQLEAILRQLDAFPTCGSACPCERVEELGMACNSWDAAQPGYSRVHTELLPLLPALAVKLRQHDHTMQAQHATLLLYNMLVVQPLCVRLSSSDPAVSAAARTEALTAAVAVRKSGLVEELGHGMTDSTNAFEAYLKVLQVVIGPDGQPLPGKVPAQLAQQMRELLEVALPDYQVLTSWMTALCRIWPSSLLAADATAALAILALSAAGKYLQMLQASADINKRLFWPHRQRQQQQQGQKRGQRSGQQQQQQLVLMPMPSDDATAAVMHTASLLLLELGQHFQSKRQTHVVPRAAQVCIENQEGFADVFVLLAVVYSAQLQVHLQRQLLQDARQQQQQQPVQPAGQPGSTSAAAACPSSSSSSSSMSPGRLAEGVLLRRADWLQAQQLHQLPGSPAVAEAWQKQCVEYWIENVMPPQLLFGAATALAKAQEGHVGGLASSSTGYAAVAPKNCFADLAALFPAMGADGSSSSSSGGDGDGNSSPTHKMIDADTCVRTTAAVAAVVAHLLQGGADKKPISLLRGARLLLLRAAVAGVRLRGAAALPLVSACIRAAGEVSPLPLPGQQSALAAAAAESTAWQHVGMLCMLLQQLMCLLKEQHSAAADTSAAGGSSGGCSSSSSTGQGDEITTAAAAAGRSPADDGTGLLPLLLRCLQLLQDAVLAACDKQARVLPAPERLEQAAFALQVAEAATRVAQQHKHTLRSNITPLLDMLARSFIGGVVVDLTLKSQIPQHVAELTNELAAAVAGQGAQLTQPAQQLMLQVSEAYKRQYSPEISHPRTHLSHREC